MIRIVQRKLIIPRGDTGTFTIPATMAASGDVAIFTIFDCITHSKIFEKAVQSDTNNYVIEFTHNDTVNLKPGKYVWDIKFYKNPQYLDNELVNGDEVNSYYAGYTLPDCEIRETGDTLLTSDDAPTSTISPESLNIINAAINEALNVKRAAVEAAETASLKADVAAASAENASNSAAAANQSATIAEARVNEIENLSVEVSTGLEGTNASATYTPSTGVLSFEIPRGNTGNGIASCVLNADFTLTINYTDGTSMTTVPIRGDTPHLTIGEVTEGPHAIATITGTDANPILNLTLPNANVPTRVSQLENDVGYLTEHQDLSSYVQNTDYATNSKAGIVKVAGLGVKMSNDEIVLAPASNGQMKRGSGDTAPIVAAQQHQSTFYGLAKAAGDTTQSQSSNAVGTYTNEAKAAIQQMLDVPSTSDIPTQVSELTNDAGYLTTETDPTVPAWAKAAQKPSYTAAEVGAPTIQEMNSAISTAIGNINSFDMAVVQTLPTQDINTHTIYLVPKTGETNDVYDEYVYINDNWEMVGNTQVDLSNYVQKTDYATMFEPGVIQAVQMSEGTSSTYNGVALNSSHILRVYPATENGIKSPFNKDYAPIVPKTQHFSTFYGLAKAAGDSTQSASSNAVGTYTDEAKAAIQQMLDVPSTSDVSVYATKANTILETTLSGGRKANTTVGAKSFAFGDTVEASGTVSFATGSLTNASGSFSSSFGYGTIANLPSMFAIGLSNVQANTYSEWEANKSYNIGDRVLYTVIFSPTAKMAACFECKTANNDAEFTIANWENIGMQNIRQGDQLFVVGNGLNVSSRSNAYALDWDGTGHYMGDVYVHANADSSGGTKLATVDDIPDVPVQDVQVAGISVVTDGVANVPIASGSTYGVAKVSGAMGVDITNGFLTMSSAEPQYIQSGTHARKAIVPKYQHESTFYGLAKAAGADMKNIANTTVGTYPDAQKEAIQSMLGITQMLAPENPNLVASQAYAIGDVFAANGHLYKATAAIAQDATIIPDTNCVETTMAEAGGKIKDVQVNGVSVVGSDGIASIPKASSTVAGVSRAVAQYGLTITAGDALTLQPPSDAEIKAATTGYKALSPYIQHKATFYGLAKAAGDTTQSQSANTVGTYTTEAKAAIQTMLDVPSKQDLTDLIAIQSIQPTDPDTKIWIDDDASGSVQVPTVSEMESALATKVDDVQVNGVSVVSNGVADIPKASSSALGLIKVNGNGIAIDSGGAIYLAYAGDASIKGGNSTYSAITTTNQHKSVFYGLAKASGDTTQAASDNAVGTYTDAAKTAIKNMIGVEEGLKVVRLI